MFTARYPWGLCGRITLIGGILNFGLPRAQGQCFHGDLDRNTQVGLSDVSGLSACLSHSGPGCPRGASCGPVDLDTDGDVDLVDAAGFQRLFGATLGPSSGGSAFEVSAGVIPVSVALGDLDGDGDLDMAAANLGSGNISVSLNLGHGTFADDMPYGAGGGPWSVAIGDLDGDGDLDLAVAIYPQNVSVLLNRGDGTFADRVSYGAGREPRSVAIGDLNGDGDFDLVVANALTGNVSILLNCGDGTFADDVVYAAAYAPWSLAIGDLDGDGHLDLAVTNVDTNVSVLLNRGDGTFANEELNGVGDEAWSVAVGDLDGDGDLDLAVANAGYSFDHENDNISVLLNRGDGTFADDVFYGAGDRCVSVAIGDLNGDGNLDLAVANRGQTFKVNDSVSILFNRSDGTFAEDVLYAAGDDPQSVAIGDLDGDGDLDLAVANAGSDNVSVLFNGCVP